MKFIQLPKVFHQGEIHCLDINETSNKMLTGGKDNLVSLWDLNKFNEILKFDQSGNDIMEDINLINPIKSFSIHSSLPHIVKWVSASHFISSDTQGTIYLYDIETEISKKVYPTSFKNTDSVIDISTCDHLIAFSLSNGKVYIYDWKKNTLQELTQLCHEKPVVQRSISFDPTRNYFISIGDDTQINLYQYTIDTSGFYKFRLINKIERLFSNNPLNVKYKRISWSPDGDLVTVPTATKNQTTLISLLSKSNNWNNKISLVGHDLTCEVIKFNPHIYSEFSTDSNDLYNVVASGGSDKTLAIWNTSKTAPILVLQDCIEGEILDLRWFNNGESLIFVTSKGSFCLVTFEENELGYVVNDDVLNRLKKIQAGSINPLNFRYDHEQQSSGNTRRPLPPIEYLEQKDALRVDKIDQDESIEEMDKKPENGSANSTKEPISDLKGEIQPVLIAPPKLDIRPDSPINDSIKVKPVTEKIIKKTPPIESSTKSLLEKQKITTKNGKKRVQPLLLSNNTPTQLQPNKLPSPQFQNEKSMMEFDKPSYSVSDEFAKQNKRKLVDENGNAIKKTKREMEPIKFIGSVILNPNTSFSKIRLAVPKIRFNFQIKSKLENEFFILDVKNGSGNEVQPSRITYFKKDKEIWCDFIPKYIQLGAEGTNFWAVSTSDGIIMTYSHVSGKRLLPPLVMGSPLAFLESNRDYLMAITTIGEVQVWNLQTKKYTMTCSITTILELSNKFQDDGLMKGDNITLCAITSLGIPLITLSNGSGYLYNKDLEVWQTITESWWSFGSHYWNSADDGRPQTAQLFDKDQDQSIVELLEYKTNEEIIRKTRLGRGKYFNKISKNMIMKEGFESLENTISISHLENRILCCEILGEFKDFHKYFLIYIQRICELGFKARLFEICDELCGPELKPIDWKSKICGHDKVELLKEIVTLCSQFRDCQRVIIHFSKKIGLVTNV